MLTTAQRDKTDVTFRVHIAYYSSHYHATVTLSPQGAFTATFTLGSRSRRNQRTITRRLSDHHIIGVPRRVADEITQRVTAFPTFQELIDAEGGYNPTIFCDSVLNRVLANLYDTAQKARGDKRRAFRAGEPETVKNSFSRTSTRLTN